MELTTCQKNSNTLNLILAQVLASTHPCRADLFDL